MNAKDLPHSIELQSYTSTPDGMGGETSSFATVATVRAGIWPIPTKEIVRAAAPTMIGTHNVRIRYYPGLGASWRVKFGTRYFSIVSIVNKDEKNVQMDLLCREVLS